MSMRPNTWKAVAAGLVLAATVMAQTQSDPNPRRGLQPAGNYRLGEIETINQTNGNLMLNVPLGSLGPDRVGNNHGIYLMYNSKLYEPSNFSDSSLTSEFLSGIKLEGSSYGGWNYGIGYQLELSARDLDLTNVCNTRPDNLPYYWKLRVIFPDGSKHLLRLTGEPDYLGDGHYRRRPDGKVANPCSLTLSDATGPLVYYTTDGSYVRLEVPHDD